MHQHRRGMGQRLAMRGALGIVTLAFVGVIVADLVTHPEGVKQGGTVLVNILTATYTAMLGSVPQYPTTA